MGKGKNREVLFSAAIFIILEFAAVVLLIRSSSMQNIWINRFSHRVLAITWGSTETVRNYFNLKDINEDLALENHRLSEKLRQYQDVSLKKELEGNDSPHSDGFVYTPARIVKLSDNSQHNYIILNKGSEDGIVPNSGIITANGAVGIIDAVSKHFSYGITLLNRKTGLSARIGRSGIIAPLVWDGRRKDEMVLKNLPLQIAVNPGDTVYTSGMSDIFPGEIPLGVTIGPMKTKEPSLTVRVKLFTHFSALHHVTVCRNTGRREIQELLKRKEAGK